MSIRFLTRFSALVGIKYEQSLTQTNNAVSVEKNYWRTTTTVVLAIIFSTEKQLAGIRKKSELVMRLKIEDMKAEEETPKQAEIQESCVKNKHKRNICQFAIVKIFCLCFCILCATSENLILTRFSATVGIKYEQSLTQTNNAVSVEKNYWRTTTTLTQK